MSNTAEASSEVVQSFNFALATIERPSSVAHTTEHVSRLFLNSIAGQVTAEQSEWLGRVAHRWGDQFSFVDPQELTESSLNASVQVMDRPASEGMDRTEISERKLGFIAAIAAFGVCSPYSMKPSLSDRDEILRLAIERMAKLYAVSGKQNARTRIGLAVGPYLSLLAEQVSRGEAQMAHLEAVIKCARRANIITRSSRRRLMRLAKES